MTPFIAHCCWRWPVNRSKPAGAKGHFVEKVSVSSTMGPDLKIEPNSLFNQ
jgi:large subunit ribosomal protein L1